MSTTSLPPAAWNDTAADFPHDRCVHELFADQVRRTPDAVAVVYDDAALTYAELDRRANQLAHRLRASGVGPDTLVSLCVERSLHLAVGVLGILKAGGAYVPLDPAYPAERLAQLHGDSQAAVLLTQRALLGRLPQPAGALLLLDEPTADPWPQEAPAVAMSADSLGYVIYTSGSTGRPKGICLPHRALVNLIVWHERTLLCGVNTLQYASLSFDASFHEMFAAWCSGGTLFLLSEEVRHDLGALARFIHAHQIEKVILPVIVLSQLAEQVRGQEQLLGSLKELTTTGEQLQITGPIIQLFRRLPGCAFHNHYGPSESHVVTAYTLPADPDAWVTHPPIGRPIANTRIYLLDEQRRPVPVGATGELYIGGVCLARCYLGQPELTASRFVATGELPAGETRLYRTGDLARYRPDGCLEYLGRIDHQVKIRGFRIELGEVETVLSQHPGVREVAVLAREDAPGEKRLVAYVVPDFAAATSGAAPLHGEPLHGEPVRALGADLRARLREKLPDYMIPSALVMLAALPLTPNGKLDRRALPPPGPARPELATAYRAPRTALEREVTALWEQLLHLDGIGVEDSFFDLGGSSIHAAQFLARVRSAYGIELTFARFFAQPTVAALAAALQEQRPEGPAAATIPMVPREGGLALSLAQERLFYLYQLAPESRAYNCASCFHLRGTLDEQGLERSLQALVARHEILRTRFSQRDGRPLQLIDSPPPPPPPSRTLAVVDLQALPEAERPLAARRQLEKETQHLFNLEQGPLFRATLWRLGPGEHFLLLNFHHIIIDGWSIEVALRELALYYKAWVTHTPPALAPLPIQYADYAAWQLQQADSAAQRELVGWWKQKLQGAAPLLQLPTDHRRPAVQSFRGATVAFAIDAPLTAALRELAARSGMTLSMVLLAAYAALLHRYTRSEDLLIGIPSASRHRVELEGVLGFFINTLPLRIDLSGGPSFAELLGRVRATAIEAYERDAAPFEQIVKELRPERDPAYNPVVQLGFAPQPPAERALALPGLQAEHVEVDAQKTVFDLTLYLWEEPTRTAALFEYSTDLFTPATIARLAEQYVLLLRAALKDAQQQVAALPLLSAAERDKILQQWNPPPSAPAAAPSLYELFAEQAARAPAAPAVVMDAVTVTYGELDQRASQLAQLLQALELPAETPIGVCLERSVDLIVAFLGILKAGGVYTPLDPGYPQSRLHYMLADSAAPVVLTWARHAELLAGAGARVLCLDTPAGALAATAERRPPPVAPGQAAYLIYTSGSSGRPKGVVIEHRSAVAFVRAQQAVVGVTAESRVLHLASPSFDASVWELLLALTAGATLFPVPVAAALPGPELCRFLRQHRISIAFLAPAALAQLPREELPELTTLLTGGEACPAAQVQRWAPGRRFINAYGPTEATVCATMQVCTPGPEAPAIGVPLTNARVYVLDAAGQLLPTGVPGELYLGGASLARGYLNQPELTAQRFLPDPFAAPGARMYRTGDLGRWRADGSLEFLGRLDDQIKLRGLRIELGEIESVLREQPLIAAAAVVLHEARDGDRRLVAYLVPRAGAPTAAPAAAPATLKEQLVGDWLRLYEDVYKRADAAGDPTFNIEGWNSSFTGQPIPAAQMSAWVASTVARLQALAPRRVLELGSGSGLLLFKVAPSCAQYLGTDFSPAAVARLGQLVAARGLTQVTLQQREANQLADLPEKSFDTIILNSVVQYFPGLAYLREVLGGAVRALTAPGVIFIGDVRSLPLREAFHAAVQLYQAAPQTAAAALRDKTSRAASSDRELLLAPEFFTALASELGPQVHAEVWLKRGRGSDEMTRYRYDVVLFVGCAAPAVEPGATRHWAAVDASVAGLQAWLTQARPQVAEILAIPNARLAGDWQALQRLQQAPDCSCGELAAALAPAVAAAVAPEDLWQLGEQLGYAVRITYSATGGPACMDVLFERAAAAPYPRPWRPAPRQPAARERADDYANDPLRAKQDRDLIPQVREALLRKLPAYMIPAAFVVLDELPLTASGKLDRKRLRAPAELRPELGRDYVAPTTALHSELVAIWRTVLGVERIGIHDPFFELGGHSLLLPQVRAAIATRLGIQVPVIKLLQCATVSALAAYLQASAEPEAPAVPPPRPEVAASAAASRAVAVIGLAGRFPQAADVEELWQNLASGRECLTFFTPAELAEQGIEPELLRSPRLVPACGVLEEAMGFDAGFFGCGPKEALYMDPQHRAFLECAWAGLEDAGYTAPTYDGAIGVFAGAEAPRYWLERLGLHGGPWNAEDYQAVHGNLPDNLTTRVADKLGLRGPAITVATACSTSLVAIHLACQQLLAAQCDLALAGGVGVHSPFAPGHLYQDGGLMSRSGHCRPFDAAAEGIVSGSGVAVVVLKRLEDALRDGDHIRAVIRGSAINNDGGNKASYLAPSVEGQLAVLRKAYASADVDPATVSYIEAHGTATRLGDLVEFTALRRAFAERTERRQFCALGSVKSNLGHLGAAAGVTGLIKATLALERGLIPPTLHFTAPPAELELQDSPFFVHAQPRPWPAAAQPRRAGVSAFGVGGTNAHVVLEQAPAIPAAGRARGVQLLLLSARTPSALDEATRRLAAHLQQHPEQPLPDVAYTLQRGRAHLQHRRAVIASDAAAASARLSAAEPTLVATGSVPARPPKLVFMFPGGGTQRVQMGRELYEQEPVYREALARCARLFQNELGCDLLALLFPPPGDEPAAAAALLRPSLNNAAIFATEFALTELLQSWGLRPAAVTGHSLGEYAAACLSGVLRLEDAVALVALRGRIYDELTGGATMSVLLPEATLRARLGSGVELAAVNGPASCVVAGERAAVLRLQAELAAEGHEARLLAIDCAAHCSSVEPHLPRLTARAATLDLQAPRIPIVSNLTGGYLSEKQARDPAHWAAHLRGTVRFAAGLATLLADPDAVFLEVGPGWTLSTLCRRHPDAGAERVAVASLASAGSGRSDLEVLLLALGQLHCTGVAVDWQRFSATEQRRRVPLPTYPFERTLYDLGTRAVRTGAALPAVPPLARAAGTAVLRSLPPLAPRDALAQRLAALWSEALGFSPRDGDNFFDHGGNSFVAVQLSSKVRDELNIALPLHTLVQHPTFAALLEYVRALPSAAGGSASRRELPAPEPAPAAASLLVEFNRGAATQLPLFLIQPIGGTVFTYAALARALHPSLPVYGVRASGMEAGEEVLTALPQIVARYLESLRAVQPRGPYRLGGHSAGGIIAFAIAAQLLAEGEQVSWLLLLDSASLPQMRRTAALPLAQLLAELDRGGSAPSEGQLSLRAALQADTPFRAIALGTLQALAGAQLGPLPVRLTYVLARDEPGPLDAQRAAFWLAMTEQSFALQRVAGTHFTMMEPQQLTPIVELCHEQLLGRRAADPASDLGEPRRVASSQQGRAVPGPPDLG
jgi:amino acid adenylation domain-containing protein